MIRIVPWYESEKLTRAAENLLYTFERIILRRILGPVEDGESWRIINNSDLYNIYDDPLILSKRILQGRAQGKYPWINHGRDGKIKLTRTV